MKHEQKQLYSIAWFKIAEFVARGEKERALGVHKLLSHSITDSTLATQLEGDIFLACNDIERACQRYQQAMTLYKSEGRTRQAIAMQEQYLFLQPDDWFVRHALIKEYIELSQPNKVFYHFEQAFLYSLQSEQYHQRFTSIKTSFFNYYTVQSDRMHCYQEVFVSILDKTYYISDALQEFAWIVRHDIGDRTCEIMAVLQKQNSFVYGLLKQYTFF